MTVCVWGRGGKASKSQDVGRLDDVNSSGAVFSPQVLRRVAVTQRGERRMKFKLAVRKRGQI